MRPGRILALVFIFIAGLAVFGASGHGGDVVNRLRGLDRSVVAARIGLTLIGLALAQTGVHWLRAWLCDLFELNEPPEADLNRPKNQWPQQIAGIAENLFYPWLMCGLGSPAAAIVAGWIGIKALGSWSGWKTDPGPSDRLLRRGHQDEHRGRRRMYVFALCNAWQVAFGITIAWFLAAVK